MRGGNGQQAVEGVEGIKVSRLFWRRRKGSATLKVSQKDLQGTYHVGDGVGVERFVDAVVCLGKVNRKVR